MVYREWFGWRELVLWLSPAFCWWHCCPPPKTKQNKTKQNKTNNCQETLQGNFYDFY